MKSVRNRICPGCKQSFEADRRNARHQKYCPKAACRKTSKAASQRKWTAKPENRNYHCGREAVVRVQAWQAAHPEYRERQKAKRVLALQDIIMVQPHVFTGLISHFFQLTLQDDMASVTRSLQKLGEDIANGRKSDEFTETHNLFTTRAAGAKAVQLGGSTPGT
jgi:hypothetical protein